MLWRDLKLPAHVIAAKLSKKCLILICHHIIKADARADKYFFNAGKLAKLSQEGKIILVIHRQIFTGLWKQTLFILAGSFFKLLYARRMAKIGCRPSHIMNIALKILVLYKKLRLLYNGLMAPCLYYAPLMKS